MCLQMLVEKTKNKFERIRTKIKISFNEVGYLIKSKSNVAISTMDITTLLFDFGISIYDFKKSGFNVDILLFRVFDKNEISLFVKNKKTPPQYK